MATFSFMLPKMLVWVQNTHNNSENVNVKKKVITMGLTVLRIVHWEGKLSYSCKLSFTIVKNGYIKFYTAKNACLGAKYTK